jgi:hypothetical protein
MSDACVPAFAGQLIIVQDDLHEIAASRLSIPESYDPRTAGRGGNGDWGKRVREACDAARKAPCLRAPPAPAEPMPSLGGT